MRKEKRKTYETESPEDAVVDQEPSLFAKPGDVLPLGNTLGLCVRREQVFQSGGAEAGKEDDAEENEKAVILAEAILSGRRVVVRERKVLSGVGAGARHTSMGEEEESEEVESEACGKTEELVVCFLTRMCLVVQKGTCSRTDLVLNEPARQLLHRALALPLDATNKNDVFVALHVEGSIHVLGVARLLAFDSPPLRWESCAAAGAGDSGGRNSRCRGIPSHSVMVGPIAGAVGMGIAHGQAW